VQAARTHTHSETPLRYDKRQLGEDVNNVHGTGEDCVKNVHLCTSTNSTDPAIAYGSIT
jgi:hypothetical protein